MAVNADLGSASPSAPPDEAVPPPPDKNKVFLRLFLQNERRLYAYIFALLPNRADADDVLQETSMTMWDRFDADAPPTEFVAWGKRIAYHKVLDFYKKSQRAQARLSLIFLKRIAETAAGQADELQLDARRDALTECVEKLPARDRELLTHRFADGATTQSASQQLGRSVDAVYKALAKLREALFQCVQNTLTREGHA
ncbi:sigma-70 family RNA polymerase sigma factor [Frigoriglobus tundricola]|uniref:Putative ECF-like sigma factor SigE n=1 Tax=Frigoriglobus tundricola TaxID=2774151 RepID=A0A6M5Z306_9BACT|nr:sigma-70 family RNA polymerase sigma factor [Frigoriglobus tundricola]QJX00639.1 putative ECF-like sigma factor SigE [Frigoriglobus tundricola]